MTRPARILCRAEYLFGHEKVSKETILYAIEQLEMRGVKRV